MQLSAPPCLKKEKKEVSKTSTPGFSVVTHFLGLTQLLFNYPNGYLLSSFPTLPPVICFPAFPPVTCFQAPDNGFISPALRSDWLIAAQTDFAPYSTTLNDRFGIIVRKKAFSGITTCMYTSKTNKQTNKQTKTSQNWTTTLKRSYRIIDLLWHRNCSDGQISRGTFL